MPSIRERLTDLLLGDQKRQLTEMTKNLYAAYYQGPWVLPPEMLYKQLMEYDSAVILDLVTQLNWDVLSAPGFAKLGIDELKRAVDESRRLFKYDVLVHFSISLWTNFGFGQKVQVTPDDTSAVETWNEFWTADRNRSVLGADKIHRLSDRLLIDGNVFLAYFISELDGEVTVRYVDAKEIIEIINDPMMGDVLYYKRSTVNKKSAMTKDMYYYDWNAYIINDGIIDEAILDQSLDIAGKVKNKDIDSKLNKRTTVLIQHMAHNIMEANSDWGWPLSTAAAKWSRSHNEFRENRASVAATAAMFVQKIKSKTGSRGIDMLKSRMNSTLSQGNSIERNPPPMAGTFLENDQIELSKLPMTTGAGDAKEDGNALAMMTGLGMMLYPHYIGQGDSYRLATATSMETPLFREFSRYQDFWAQQFRDMVHIVLWAKEQATSVQYDSYESQVNIDKLIEVDLDELATAIGTIYQDIIAPLITNQSMPPDALKAINEAVFLQLLQSMGVDKADEIAALFDVDMEPADDQDTEPVVDDKNAVPASEAVNDEGKLVPRGKPLKKLDGRKKVPISLEDIMTAIKRFERKMPPEYAGILRASKIKDK